MQASRSAGVIIEDNGHAKLSVQKPQIEAVEISDPGHGEAKQQPTPPGTPPTDSTVDDEKSDKVDPAETEKSKQSSKDPIRWFGVLVPTQLRSCQASFISAVEGPVCQATGAARAMRTVEAEIRRLRKDIKKMEKGAREAPATG